MAGAVRRVELRSLWFLDSGVLHAFEEAMMDCAGVEACDRADPMLEAEAFCARPLGGLELRVSRVELELAPTIEAGELDGVVGVLGRRLPLRGVAGVSGGVRLEVAGEHAESLASSLEGLACAVGERLGWPYTTAVLRGALDEDGRVSWRLLIGPCEPLHASVVEELLLEQAIHGAVEVMQALQLSPLRHGGEYTLEAFLRRPRIIPYSTRSICVAASIPLRRVLEGRVKLRYREWGRGGPAGRIEELLRRVAATQEGVWDNGFTISAVDPLPSTRELCVDDVEYFLREAGESVVERLVSKFMISRVEHGVIVLGDGVLVEVSCSSYLDAENWVKVKMASPERILGILREILKRLYKRRSEEEKREEVKRAYERLEGLASSARSIAEIAAAASKIREALNTL